jgi:hypothetical protein
MGIEEMLTAPRGPWQSPFVERVSDPSGTSASITSSCGTSAHCGGACGATSPTIKSDDLISRSPAVAYPQAPQWPLLKWGHEYVDKGLLYYEERHREQQVQLLKERAAKLGSQLVEPEAA